MKYNRSILGVCVFSLIVNAPALSSDIHSEIPKFETSLSLPQLCASSISFRGGKIEDWSFETNIYSKYAKSRGLTLERCRQILTQSIKQKTKIQQLIADISQSEANLREVEAELLRLQQESLKNLSDYEEQMLINTISELKLDLINEKNNKNKNGQSKDKKPKKED